MYNNKITEENLKSINSQDPATKNQIKNEKPSIIKNSNVLEGYIANSLNAGHIKPIAYQYIMAGSKVMDYRLRMNIKMLTPKTPAYQKLKAVFRVYFVPNSRVWKDAEKFISQKGGNTESKVINIPNIGATMNKYLSPDNGNTYISLTNSDKWRDSWISTYIPRYQSRIMTPDETSIEQFSFPSYSVLPIRGFKAIYNDFERNKEYDTPLQEFDDDSDDLQYLIDNMMRSKESEEVKTNLRGKRQNSYYTNYRTELLGEIEQAPTINNDYMVTLVEYEKRLAELRSQAENVQANDWDIISKIRGSKPLTEGKVQLLGTREIGLNYISVPQTTYNTNSDIAQEYQSLGTEGAYSFTEVDISLFKMQDFNEEGYLHVIMQVTADNVFETGFDRIGLNINRDDQYRPDLVELKNDVLFDIEKGSSEIATTEELTNATGYKRKFSEYFKGCNCINGDIMSQPFYLTNRTNDNIELTNTMIENQRSYQFFEIDEKYGENYEIKNIWQDYTDLMINDNQAYKQEVTVSETVQGKPTAEIRGQNQIFFIGMQTIVENMPIDENIKANYTKWGEK